MPLDILVTGASGLLGNRLGDVLGAAGHRVTGTYRANPDLVWTERFTELVPCDLADEAQVEAKLARPYDVIVHAAALAKVDRCEKHHDEAYAANVIATRHVVSLARRRGIRVLNVSTASVFDGEAGAYVEAATPNPCNYYSWTKLLAEEIVLAGCDSLSVRATLVGVHPRRKEQANFVEWLVGELRASRDMTLFDDVVINPLTDLTLATLIAQLVMGEFGRRVLHAGTTDLVSKADVGRALAKQFPAYAGKLTIASTDAREHGAARRAKNMWLDVAALAAMGFRYDVAGELQRLAACVLGNEGQSTRGSS